MADTKPRRRESRSSARAPRDTQYCIAWNALVLEVAFPNDPNPRDAVRASATNEMHAIKVMFDLTFEFDDVRSAPGGLRKIFLGYERWLRTPEW